MLRPYDSSYRRRFAERAIVLPFTSQMGTVPRFRLFLTPLAAFLFASTGLCAQSLTGSRLSMARQQSAAHDHDFDFLRTPSDVRRFVRAGHLVRIPGNSHYQLDEDVSFPYARPAVKTFLERLGQQYKATKGCGERLVVTSLVRPITRQPVNASHSSVHPTGMAIDLRYSRRAACRAFLERTLLALEGRGLVEATRERWPAHYHVTVYPGPYKHYLGQKGVQVRTASSTTAQAKKGEIRIRHAAATRYRVKRGDTLSHIARQHRIPVERIRTANHLPSSRLRAGQLLSIPAR